MAYHHSELVLSQQEGKLVQDHLDVLVEKGRRLLHYQVTAFEEDGETWFMHNFISISDD